ncbi:6202_t:CDS:2, partial [Entrophospora sp. SA101]
MQSYEILNEELKKTENLLNKYKKEYEQNMLYTSNLTIQVKKLQQELNELSYKYQMLEESNKILIDKLNKKFDTHEKRVEAIIEIALAERENFFNDLNEEKSQLTNNIDNLIENTSNISSSKYCLNCNEKNIDNRKKNCPKCYSPLPTLTELQKNFESIVEEKNLSDKSMKEIIFKPYNPENESKIASLPRI